MYERIIRIEPFDFIDFQEFRLVKYPGEHYRAVVKGHIPLNSADSLVEKHLPNTTISIMCFDDDGNEKVLLNGIAEDISIQEINGLNLLSLEIVSRSILMDVYPHTRTFQNKSMTYNSVCETIVQESKNCSMLLPEHSRDTIKKMFVQYQETDWQFAKRMASRLNTLVFANHLSVKPSLAIGMLQTKNTGVIHATEYRISKDAYQIEQFNAKGLTKYSENNALQYHVRSRDIYDLCDCVVFLGKELYVYAVDTKLEEGVLHHYYILKDKKGFMQPEYFNKLLIGASLSGTVAKIRNDLVKVKIFDDVRNCTYQWFAYSTVYSSPDNTGWYFMPEVNDEIRLQFPNEHEEDAYVISSVHGGERYDADTKSICTKYGKAVVFMPHAILITNGAGSDIRLDDRNGIMVTSTKAVEISATDNINISSRSKVIINGNKGVRIQQAGNQIIVEDNIDMSAGHIRTR